MEGGDLCRGGAAVLSDGDSPVVCSVRGAAPLKEHLGRGGVRLQPLSVCEATVTVRLL